MNPSFEEKSVWVQLIAMLLVLGGYFLIAGKMLAAGIETLPPYVPLFILAVILMVIVLIAGHLLAAITGRPEPRDERDRLITWRAESNSAWLLALGVLASITAMTLGLQSVWVAHLLLASLFLSSVLGFVLQLVYYRRGL